MKYLYHVETWTGNKVYAKMMEDINRLGAKGWRVIQITERQNNQWLDYTVFFEMTLFEDE